MNRTSVGSRTHQQSHQVATDFIKKLSCKEERQSTSDSEDEIDSWNPHRLSRTQSVALFVSVGATKTLAAMTLTLMVPFFFLEAGKRTKNGGGVGFHAETGLVFTIGKLIEILFVPLVSKDLPNIGSKYLLILSTVTAACANLLFSFLEDVDGLSWFLGLAYVARIIQSVAVMALTLSAFTLLVGFFPESVGRSAAFLEGVVGLGWAIGPLIAGGLFEIGGFKLPFFVGSGSLVAAAISAVFILPADNLAHQDRVTFKSSWWRVMAKPWAWIICIDLFLAEFAQAMAEVTLPEYLAGTFHTATHVSGFALFVLGMTNFLASPCVGYLVDRKGSIVGIEILGCVLCVIGCALVGPADILHLSPSLVYSFCAMVFLAAGAMSLIVAGTAHITILMTTSGLGDPREVMYFVAGLVRIAVSLGYGLGGISSNALKAAIGFSNAYSVVGLVFASQAVIISIAYLLHFILQRISAHTHNYAALIVEENLYTLTFGRHSTLPAGN